MTAPKDTDTYFAAMRNALVKSFPSMQNYSVVREHIRDNTAVTNYTGFELSLESKEYGRAVKMVVTNGGVDKVHLHLAVINTRDDKADRLKLQDYVSKIFPSNDPAKLLHLSKIKVPSLESKITVAFDNVLQQSKNEFDDILSGKKWLNISTNWHGYR